MKYFFRTLLAFLVGVFATMLSLTALEGFIPVLFGTPTPPSTSEGMAAYIENISLAAKLAFIISYLLAGMLGGYVCAWVGPKPSKPWATIGVALAYTAAGIVNFSHIPTPFWIVISCMAMIATSPFIGYSIRK